MNCGSILFILPAPQNHLFLLRTMDKPNRTEFPQMVCQARYPHRGLLWQDHKPNHKRYKHTSSDLYSFKCYKQNTYNRPFVQSLQSTNKRINSSMPSDAPL